MTIALTQECDAVDPRTCVQLLRVLVTYHNLAHSIVDVVQAL